MKKKTACSALLILFQIFSTHAHAAPEVSRILVKTGKSLAHARKLSLEGWQLIQVPTLQKSNLLKQLQADPAVEWAEEDQRYSVDSLTSKNEGPNDPLFGEQWSLANTHVLETQSLVRGDASDILVAVVDTGIDLDHPDLATRIFTNLGEIANNGKDDDQNGYIDDVHGYNFEEKSSDTQDDFNHGSHVSGIIGAIQNNGIGIAGIASHVRILPVKWMKNGSGWGADAIEAILYAVKMGAKVINASWGGIGDSKALDDAVRAAEKAGVLFVASAGNNHTDNDVQPRHPANLRYSNVISVADLNENDELSSTSNYGKSQVEIGAPGTNILSTMMNKQYGKLSGTSMAAAHVSGVAALLLSLNPKLTAQELKKIILATAIPTPTLEGKTITGGRIDALAAAKEVLARMNRPTPFYEFAQNLPKVMMSGDLIHPDHIEDEEAVTGLALTFVRMVNGIETPVEKLNFKSQLHADGGFQTYQTDEKGFLQDLNCAKTTFTLSIPLEAPRYSVTNGSGSYAITFPTKCGVHQKIIFDEKTNNGQAVAIWQTAVKAEKKLFDEIGLDFWKRPIDFIWPAKGDFYDGDSVNLTLGYQWDVVSHEMGHAIYDRGRIGAFGGGEHYIDRCNDITLSLSEGWASFYAGWLNFALTDPDPGFQYMVPRRAPIKIETIPADVCGKSTNEWRVIGFMWDLIDQHNDGESLSIPFSKLWTDTSGSHVITPKGFYDQIIQKGEDRVQPTVIWNLNFPDEQIQ